MGWAVCPGSQQVFGWGDTWTGQGRWKAASSFPEAHWGPASGGDQAPEAERAGVEGETRHRELAVAFVECPGAQCPSSRPPGISDVFRQEKRGGEAVPAVACPHVPEPALQVTLLPACLSAGLAPGKAETLILRKPQKVFLCNVLDLFLSGFSPKHLKSFLLL